MSKYIDADRLMERYKATCEIVCQYSKKQRDVMCSACGVGSCVEILEDFPTADVVEVVRCKDCKWFGDIGCAIRIVDDSDRPSENDFCSFAERKDNG